MKSGQGQDVLNNTTDHALGGAGVAGGGNGGVGRFPVDGEVLMIDGVDVLEDEFLPTTSAHVMLVVLESTKS